MKIKNNSIPSLKITPDIIDYYLTVLKEHNPNLKPIFRQNGSVRICVINYRKLALMFFSHIALIFDFNVNISIVFLISSTFPSD